MKRASNARPIRRAFITAFGSVLAAAQGTSAQETTDSRGVVRIEVTGSNIPRTEGESAAVQIITREEIALSAADDGGRSDGTFRRIFSATTTSFRWGSVGPACPA